MTWPRPVLVTIFLPQDVVCCQGPPTGERVATTLQKIFPKCIKIFNTISFHIWSEYKAIIEGIMTNCNIFIKILLTYRRQPINEWRQKGVRMGACAFVRSKAFRVGCDYVLAFADSPYRVSHWGKSMSASDLHNALASILNLFNKSLPCFGAIPNKTFSCRHKNKIICILVVEMNLCLRIIIEIVQ